MERVNEDELKEKIIERLKLVYDPEIPANIYDLGLIYEIELKYENKLYFCDITMTLTTPSCPVADGLQDQVKYAVQALDEIFEVYVKLVFDPIWSTSMITEEGREILELSGMIINYDN